MLDTPLRKRANTCPPHHLENLPPDSKQREPKFVNCFTTSVSSDLIGEAWAIGLNSEISAQCPAFVLSTSAAGQSSTMHRVHYSKTKLNHLFPPASPERNHCCSAEGSLECLFWFCLFDYSVFQLLLKGLFQRRAGHLRMLCRDF